MARNGEGPALLNCVTYRHSGHYVGDAEVYRDVAEVEQWKAADPIARLESALVAADWLDGADLEATWEAARVETAAAEEFAVNSPDPDPATALDYVYTPAGEVDPVKRMSFGQATVDATRLAMREDDRLIVLGEDISWGGNFGQFRGLLGGVRLRPDHRHAHLGGADHVCRGRCRNDRACGRWRR